MVPPVDRAPSPSTLDDSLLISLEDQLYQEMQYLPHSPFRELKQEDLWKLMFMERAYTEQGKSAYETEEPGYLTGVYKGYLYMLQTLHEELTPELYRQLHDHCIEGVTTGDNPRGIPKGFRCYEDGGEAFYLQRDFTLSSSGLRELNQRYRTWTYQDPATDDIFYLLKEALQDPTQTTTGDRPAIKLKPTRPEFCSLVISRAIAKYQEAPRGSEDETLHAIAALCQDLDQFHVFVDGNIRTTGILLLNRELLKNGLPPASMKDVNQLDCLSIHEIVTLIREGQAYFSSLEGI